MRLLIISLFFYCSAAIAVEINFKYGQGFGGNYNFQNTPGIVVDICIDPTDDLGRCDLLNTTRDWTEHIFYDFRNSSDSVTVWVFEESIALNGYLATAGYKNNIGAINFAKIIRIAPKTVLHELGHIFGFIINYDNYDNNTTNTYTDWTGNAGIDYAKKIHTDVDTLQVIGSHINCIDNSILHTAIMCQTAPNGLFNLGVDAYMFSDIYNYPVIDVAGDYSIDSKNYANNSLTIRLDVSIQANQYASESLTAGATDILVVADLIADSNTIQIRPQGGQNCSLKDDNTIECIINSIDYDSVDTLYFDVVSTNANTSNLTVGSYTATARIWNRQPHIDPDGKNNIIASNFSIVEPPIPYVPPVVPVANSNSSSGGIGSLGLIELLLLLVMLLAFCRCRQSGFHRISVTRG